MIARNKTTLSTLIIFLKIVLVLGLSPIANCLSLQDRAQLKQLTEDFVRKTNSTIIPPSIKSNMFVHLKPFFHQAKMKELLAMKDARLEELTQDFVRNINKLRRFSFF